MSHLSDSPNSMAVDDPGVQLRSAGISITELVMMEIGFSLCGSGFAPGPMDSLMDSFWIDSSKILEPPLCELKPTSPGSTKSTSSLDSLLQGASNTASGSTPPLSPWPKDIEERLLPASPERKGSNFGDPVNSLWQSDVTCECHLSSSALPSPPTLPDQNQTKKTVLLGTDLLQGFDANEATSTSDGLEEQLASADNAWTAALELSGEAYMIIMATSRLVSHALQNDYSISDQTIKVNNCGINSDPESTETGSEGEDNLSKGASPQRNRSRVFIEGRIEVVEDLCSSDLDDSDEEDVGRSPTKKAALTSPLLSTSTQTLRHSQSSKIDYTEPWWPQRSSSVFQRLNAREFDVGGGGIGRSRRQLELWEFILRSLDARPANDTGSAFKWVNRSVGVFRVTDTQKAAKEWGLYRGNERMDYEKMARAMRDFAQVLDYVFCRFYYKECVLRKASKQLHFQFSMPFVSWSQRHNSCESFSTAAS
ncbi:unnamed protein product [Hydatigera taeniaeformis]|uniref:ETS domain-containing protein n=1 Tax=Hydatigena taeniaeformis TaxID=6205 RepID=A0A0R3WMH1_HYDTA|nr:unnamed protein product [Hydatigera taeniaeformis]